MGRVRPDRESVMATTASRKLSARRLLYLVPVLFVGLAAADLWVMQAARHELEVVELTCRKAQKSESPRCLESRARGTAYVEQKEHSATLRFGLALAFLAGGVLLDRARKSVIKGRES